MATDVKLIPENEIELADEGQAVQTRLQKAKEGKAFKKLKVMKGLEVHKNEFKEEQNKDETLKG